MECGSIDLAGFLRKNRAKITEGELQGFWRQMLEAVHVIHQQGIIHSDLKPANFMLVEGRLKLIDFGIAHTLQVRVILINVCTGSKENSSLSLSLSLSDRFDVTDGLTYRISGSSSVKEPVTFTRDVEQRSQNNDFLDNEYNSDKTKKNFTGSYTEVNPDLSITILIRSSHSAIYVGNAEDLGRRFPNRSVLLAHERGL